jgi:hypothetical protein
MAKKKKFAAFHREVGELVFWFAAAENALYAIALELLGGPKIARAVLPSFHLERAVELVRNLARELHPESPHLPELHAALIELKTCARQRNELFHSVSLPRKLPATGREVLQLTSVRTLGYVERERTHVADLEKRVRSVTIRFMQAAIDMGIFSRRPKKNRSVLPAANRG